MSGPVGPEIVYVGDDFTGASDTLATFSRGGWRTRLFLDPPDEDSVRSQRLEAVGVATETRTLNPEGIARYLDRIAPPLVALLPRFVHYKVCSTFDSSPRTGSIGAAVRTLVSHFDPAFVAILGGQPSLGRYCIFGHLFATASDNVVHRIDRHPVMRSHPATPMTESDLRLHLSAQGLPLAELVSWTEIGTDADVLAGHVTHRISTGKRHFLFDASETAHIRTIGHTLRRLQSGGRPILFVGASSVAETLTLSRTNVMPEGEADRRIAPTRAIKPCFIIAGSRSHVTAGQIAAARRFRKIAVEPGQILDVSMRAATAADCAKALREGHNVLAHLVPDQDYGMAAADLARCTAEFAAAVLDDVQVPSLGVAGGDTSSIIVRRLGFESLAFGRDLDRGVAVCVGRSRNPTRDGTHLMLKGGQMGAATIFDHFAAGLS